MKKIIPFKKNIIFNTNISEITSISLEENLEFKDLGVCGNFIVSGNYKMNDTSVNTEEFRYDLPFEINIDEKYIITNAQANVSDFYYEIVDDNVLSVNIEVTLDKLEEKIVDNKEELIEQDIERTNILEEGDNMEEANRCIEKEDDLFKETSTDEYVTYNIYIVREGDTLDSIMSNYNITKELILEYNDIKDLKVGDKLIIPSND